MPDRSARPRQARLAGDLGQAEIGDPGRPVRRDENVAGLDVPVDDPVLVGRGQAVGDLGGEGQGLGGWERAALDLGPQTFAAAEGHGDEHLPGAALADLVDGADVRVIEDRGRTRLMGEPLPGLGVVNELRGQELEGDGAPELEVVRFVDDTHPAASDLADDAVLLRDHAPYGQASGGRLDGFRNGGRGFRLSGAGAGRG